MATIEMADDKVIIPKVEGVESEDEQGNPYSLVDMLKRNPVRTVQALVNACEKGMQTRASHWDRYRRKYRRGLRYGDQSMSKNPLYSTNYIMNVVETLKANLMESLPSTTMQPVEEGDDNAADAFTKILRKELNRAGFKDKIETTVQHGAITGTGWLKFMFDPKAAKGKGALAVEAIAPEDVLVLSTMIDYKLGDVFIHRRRDVPEAEIKATYDITNVSGKVASAIELDRSLEGDRKVPLLQCFDVYEAWVKDYEDNNWIICTIAGNTLLKKPTVSVYKHKRHPFVPFYDVLDVGADNAYVLGVGEIEEIETLQDLADALDMRIYKNVKQITSRQRVLNPASGINREDLDDSPNRVYLCTGRPQDAMMWDNPPMLSQEVFTYRERIEDRIQIVSGIFDVTQGKKPSGIQAARAIGALQQAAAKRLMKKKASLCRTIQDGGGLAAEIIKQFYTDERIIRIAAGEQFRIVGDYPESLSETVPEEGVDNGSQDDTTHDDMLLEKARWKSDNGIDLVLSDIDFEYDIVASTDSALPEDRSERAALASDLFRLGAIDREALLDALDYPDRKSILKRLDGQVTGKTPPELNPDNQDALQQQQMMEQQAQMQQAQMQNSY